MLESDQLISVLLAADESVAGEIKERFKNEKQIAIIAEARNGTDILKLLRSGIKADVILLDLTITDADLDLLFSQIKTVNAEINIVILSSVDDEKFIKAAFLKGAVVYLLRDSETEEFIYALKRAGKGGRHLSANLSLKIINKLFTRSIYRPAQSSPSFSDRETEVLQLVAEGWTNAEMSEKLFLSKRTVEGHRQSLMEKTGMRNTASLIRFAVLSGIIQ
jgi:DNA-binding NarL/FixJ family response regulator